MVDPGPHRHLSRPIVRTVIDDEELHDIDSRDRARKACEHSGDPGGLVQTRDLDDELHVPCLSLTPGTGTLALPHRRKFQPNRAVLTSDGATADVSVLIDIAHPAHVHFFRPVAQTLLAEGVEVRIVARDKDVTVRLLEAADLPFEVLPMGRPGSGPLVAAVELIRRAAALRRRIRRWDTKVVLTRNPSGVLAALGTPARSIFDTDDGRSVGAHYWLARPFADVITSSVHDPEQHGRRHRRYRALKAQMFLHPDRFTPDPEIRRRYLDDTERLTVVRFSAHDASHDRRIQGISEAGRDRVLDRLTAFGPVLVSIERAGLQLIRPEDAGRNSSAEVPPEHFHHLLASASLFVGDSQSVAAEAAILGVPSLRLSSFSGRTFYLELLESSGLMRNFLPGQETALLAEVEMTLDILSNRGRAAQTAAIRLNAATEDLHVWFLDLVRGLL